MKRALDAVLLLALAVYILAGVPLAPFHGDEATQIAMSRDFGDLFLTGQPERVRFAEPPPDAARQELRLLNGTVNTYSMGVAWWLAGFAPGDLNEQWDWGADWDFNWANNHAPSRELLTASRMAPGLFLVVGLLAVFVLAWKISGRPAAWVAAVLFALHPALLLNGRRAMMEGSLLAFTALAALAFSLWMEACPRRRWFWAALAGLCGGLALASKHTALLALIPIGGFALAWVLWQERRAIPARFGQLLLIGAVAALTFYALNPAWWGDPLARVPDVLRLRSDLLAGQTAAFGGYSGLPDQIAGFLRQVIAPAPQYAEVPGWDAWLAHEIAAYEASGLAGIIAPRLLAVLTVGLGAAGVWALVRNRRARAPAWLVLAWLGSAALLTLLLTPVEWQRYYLPVHLPLVLVMGVGAGWIYTKIKANAKDAKNTKIAKDA